MRIAFLGKGGSGKTTLSGLFALYADNKQYRVGLLDVDVNSHTAEVLGAESKPRLSDGKDNVLHYLAGTNAHVKSEEFLNTTPPGIGSNYWTLERDNFINATHAASIGEQSLVLTAGSYQKEAIGIDCHHSTQMIAENLLSHAKLEEHDIVVTDCVAGSDLFGTTLYDQDLIVIVAKPEREALSVIHQVKSLAADAGVADRIVVVANQVQSDAQRMFIEREMSDCIGVIDANQNLADDRMLGTPLGLAHVSDQAADVFDTILSRLKTMKQSEREHYNFIVRTHKKVAAQGWVDGAYRPGMHDQIDETYELQTLA